MADEALDDEELDDETTEEGEEEGGRRLSGKIIVLAGIPVLLIVVGVAAFFLGWLDPVVHMVMGEPTAEEKAAAADIPKEVIFYDLPEMLVNIKANSKQSNFLKVRIALELEKTEAITRLETLMPLIIDNFQVYLRELRIEDLDGSAGIFKIKEELLARVNAAVYPVLVSDILFKEILIQ